MRKLPIGIQSFEALRRDKYLYVDKTQHALNLIQSGKYYFLSRPRRFGKSLFLSTLKAYFEGKRELFTGLKILELTQEAPEAWQAHPVLHFDFNGADYSRDEALEKHLDSSLTNWEKIYGYENRDEALGDRFNRLLITAHNQTGRGCVVLIDEYDKPLLEVMDNDALMERNKKTFKGFFSVLKKADEHIAFAFITGVTKFTKVSLFSDLNNLNDISLGKKYADICGITEEELLSYFQPEIAELAEEQTLTIDECIKELKDRYDGYHFFPNSPGVYNPFSLLKALYAKDLGSYWFATGTPTFLLKKLKSISFDVKSLTDKSLNVMEYELSNYRGDNEDPIPLLYQAGYLTIVGFNRKTREYTLAFPNEEVSVSFLQCLLPEYAPRFTSASSVNIFILRKHIESGDLDGIRNVITALFANIPYTNNDAPFEHYFQTVIYIVFTLLGQCTQCEMHTATGRVDCTLATDDYIYLFEFKRDSTAKAALEQIEQQQYALPFVADKRTLYKIGVAFDSETRLVSDWLVGE